VLLSSSSLSEQAVKAIDAAITSDKITAKSLLLFFICFPPLVSLNMKSPSLRAFQKPLIKGNTARPPALAFVCHLLAEFPS
jgi:hypothetical protein